MTEHEMTEHEECTRQIDRRKEPGRCTRKIAENFVKIRLVSFENWLSIAVLFGCFLLLLEISYYITPVWLDLDSSYNLQVVDLLAQGEGYASYGTLRGNGKWLFDPYITTGPAVLVPLSFVWYVTDGSVLATHLAIFFALWLYVAGLFFLLKNWSKESTLLPFALAASLSLCVEFRVAVLGEMPGLAAIVWAAWAIRSNKPVVAAVLAGLAVQMKVVLALPGISLLLIYVVWDFLRSDKIRVTKIFTCCLVFISPTILFELYRLISVGSFENYLHSVEEYRWFTSLFSVDHVGEWFAPDIIGGKISVIYKAFNAFAWIACGISLLLVLLGWVVHLDPAKSHHERQGPDREELIRASLVGLMVAALAVSVVWVTQLKVANSRLPQVVLLLFFPALMAISGYYYVHFLKFLGTRKFARICLRMVITLCTFILIAALVERAMSIHREGSLIAELFAEQKRVSDLIIAEDPKSLYVDGWFQNPNYLLLTGKQGLLAKTGEHQIMVIQKCQVVEFQKCQVVEFDKNFEQYRAECDDVLYFSTLTFVCRLPDYRSGDDRLRVVDWGPRNTRSGVVPNKQPDGNMGMWVKVDKVDRRQFGPVKIYFAGHPAIHGHFTSGEVATAAFPPRRVREPGRYEVTIEQTATGRMFHVGYFVVE